MPTGIEWCDETFNPWWGCERVSPACAHCYADTLSKRYANGVQLWGAGHEFRFMSESTWAKLLAWARTLPAKLGRRPRIFCASMADVFEERDELDEHRDRLFELIEATPELDWLLLTKRPEFARDWLRAWYENHALAEWTSRDGSSWGVYPNIWIGTSIENARYTWRADVLREIPAAVRFISAEPLLGSLFETRLWELPPDPLSVIPVKQYVRKPLDLTGIDWVIAGGESGPKARPSHPEWFRELRDVCADQHVAFLFKQWGAWAPEEQFSVSQLDERGYHYRDVGGVTLARLGKKRAGRELDGRTWDEFPATLERAV